MLEKRVARTRIGRIRFKSGGTLVPLRVDERRRDAVKNAIRQRVDAVLEGHGEAEVAGFALVIWSKDTGSTCDFGSDGTIPVIMVPDFVRNRLLAEKIEEWTLESLKSG